MKPPVNRYRSPKNPLVIPTRVAERAATRYKTSGECWISTYSVASHGYAQISWQEAGRTRGSTAHRAAWVYRNGMQIPKGHTVDHLCKNRRCVNPGHLSCISNFENARRTFGKDWSAGTCANGHPNSELVWDGRRYKCKPCDAIYRENRRKRKASSNYQPLPPK